MRVEVGTSWVVPVVKDFVLRSHKWSLLRIKDGSRLSNVKILITLPYREGCVRPQEFVTKDLGEEEDNLIYMNRDSPHFSIPDKRRFWL